MSGCYDYWWLQFERERVYNANGPAITAENFALALIKNLLDNTQSSLYTGEPQAGGSGFLNTPTITVGFWNAVAVNSLAVNELAVHLRGAEIETDITLTAQIYGQDDQLLETQTKRIYALYPPVTFSFRNTTSDVSKLILQVDRATSGFYVTGLEIYTSPYTLDASHVMDFPITEEIDPFCLELPVNEMTITFSDGRNHVFERRQPFEVYGYNYISRSLAYIGKFFVREARNLFGTTYRIVATDSVGLLTSPGLPERYYSDVPFLELVYEIVNGEAGIAFTDDDMLKIRLTGVLEAGDKRSQILQLCAAANVICDCSGNGALTLRYLKTEEDETGIASDHVYLGGEISWEDKKSTVLLENRTFTVLESDSSDGYSEIRQIASGDQKTILGINGTTIAVTDPQEPDTAEQTEDWTGNYLQMTAGLSEVSKRALMYLQRNSRYQVKILWGGELPGDYVSIPSQDGKLIKGNIVRMDFVLSAKIAADIEVLVDAIVNVENDMVFSTKSGAEYQAKTESSADALGIIF